MTTVRRTSRGIAVGCLPSPIVYGAPSQYVEWRDEQEEALVLLTDSDNRFSFLNLPTGSGKTLLAYMYCLMTNKRGLILVETKGLADQYMKDLGPGAGGVLVDVRGANNYPCPALSTGGQYSHLASYGQTNCDSGPCKVGMYCKLKENGCPLYDKIREAREAQIVVTNYANWIAIGKARRGEDDEEKLGEFDVLIMDECHRAAEQTSSGMTVELDKRLVLSRLPDEDVPADWRGWLGDAQQQIKAQLADFQVSGHGSLKSKKHLISVSRDLDLLLDKMVGKNKWIIETATSKMNWVRGLNVPTIEFQPLWPAPWCEEYLFRGIPRVIGMSAIVNSEDVHYLGLKPSEVDFWEFDSSFPVTNRPVYFLPSVYMKYDMSEKDRMKWVQTIDRIAGVWKDFKGIVHTVSYERAEYYGKHSVLNHARSVYPFRRLFCLASTGSTATAVQLLKSPETRNTNTVLVAPSLHTGYDFPDDQCRFQIIGKIPFPDKRTKITRARCADNPDYANQLVMQYIVQAAGRSTRSKTDWSTVFIIDSVWKDWYNRNRHLAPKYFRDAVKNVNGIPKPNERKEDREKRIARNMARRMIGEDT